jgi:hypothetical protein
MADSTDESVSMIHVNCQVCAGDSVLDVTHALTGLPEYLKHLFVLGMCLKMSVDKHLNIILIAWSS